LDRGPCTTDLTGGGGPTVNCSGPFTRWGGYGSTWYGGWTTQVDIYLDAAYALANADSYSGNLAALTTTPTDPTVKGTRFDYSSAVNNEQGDFIRDFGFNVATGPDPHGNLTCSGFIATAGMNVNRSGADAYDPGHGATCIPDSRWYTFKHKFSENMTTHNLEVLMQIIPVGSSTPAASWTIEDTLDHIHGADPATNVGCNRYGWFTDQEIWGLPIDNASIDGGCTAPLVPVGKITPTGTTCQQYRDNTAPTLGQLQYTAKGTKINAVTPGVFFYYTKVSGNANDTVDMTQEHTGTAPVIPIQQGQVVLYNASTCKVVKWTATLTGTGGTATATLPSKGDFIIGTKYNPSSLKGQPMPNPTTVTYTFDMELNTVLQDFATIDLVPKT